MSELHDNAETFVLCALADDTSSNQDKNYEIGMFINALILAHKEGQINAAQCAKCKTEKGLP
ncbi:hypothetical protein BS333_09525 [Vibrio azureus]|uniref:Uncharacterized protein n=1 Tax=Vibrio azureus NBRC 104587 TaxID=1219077 RepID=U3A4U4_9VIBR|nr:hypothetical protein [Vibrio azureus]AUI86602.1 hypothetical protein BS333_09525 [Vibrio azureus]GAD75031.1 hypothetical protein VAZ01S_018_00070 [Vibrio azureus NBRC 104587]